MIETAPTQSALRADRAERMLEVLRARDPDEADVQASAMLMAGLKMLQEVRGTPAVLDALSRLGGALAEEQAEPASAAEAAKPGRAGEIYTAVAARPAPEQLAQANSMLAAAAALLIDHKGAEGAIARLAEIADGVRVLTGPAAPADTPAPPEPAPPEPAQPVDRGGRALAYLRALPRGEALAEANDVLAAASTFIGETIGAASPAPPAPAPEVISTPQLACALLEQLRTMPRWHAHERARAVLAGAASYLHEVFGRSYATAVCSGALDAATAYGVEMRGGRDSLDTLQ